MALCLVRKTWMAWGRGGNTVKKSRYYYFLYFDLQAINTTELKICSCKGLTQL